MTLRILIVQLRSQMRIHIGNAHKGSSGWSGLGADLSNLSSTKAVEVVPHSKVL